MSKSKLIRISKKDYNYLEKKYPNYKWPQRIELLKKKDMKIELVKNNVYNIGRKKLLPEFNDSKNDKRIKKMMKYLIGD